MKEKKVTDTTTSKTAKKKPATTKVVTKKATKATATKKITTIKKESIAKKITFQLRFKTNFGQQLFVTGNHNLLDNNDIEKAIPLTYFNEDFWAASIDVKSTEKNKGLINYNYFLKSLDGTISYDSGNDKQINLKSTSKELLFIDGWNYTGYIENAFYTVPFQKVLLKENFTELKITKPRKFTHTFQIKSPLLKKGQTLCLIGGCEKLGNWNVEKAVLLNRNIGDDQFKVDIDLSKETFPIDYKYGVYDTVENKFLQFEQGDNRIIFDEVKSTKKTIVNDVFVNLPSTTWRGSGVAIPVFSLKTEKSFGVGEFTDMNLLVDWCSNVGLKLIQVLPINDTTANHNWQDSYPYAAISAFALHPIYINLNAVTEKKNIQLLKALESTRIELNKKEKVDYEEVIKVKTNYLKKIYSLQGQDTFKEKEYQDFFSSNKHWLVPYAVFCYLRDEYGTSNFYNWPAYKKFKQKDIDELIDPKSKALTDISFHYFVQYHLHLQLQNATQYAHSKSVVVKGDIPIGIYRYGVDAWQNPNLYHLDVQAGAPPDDFAIKGQNWGFPTYNWENMKADGFAWWNQRFEQMTNYFDTFRIDHILGFFRIWSIPTHAVEGILGYFIPAIPVHISEFQNRNIDFNSDRYTKPFITDHIIWEQFGYDNEKIKLDFLVKNDDGNYSLKQEFAAQRQVEKHFAVLESNDINNKLKLGLYNLISNVILFNVTENENQEFHFRFAMEKTSSFSNLDYYTQKQLKELYINYFFNRQDALWKQEALQKLPALRRVTNMLICGEDLGLVPDCVPDVMRDLGLLSLEIQRMPKANNSEFFHPADAPYLSVVTPSTHDMSTIRGWWEEDKPRIQRFFNHQLREIGAAPNFCEAWINQKIVEQHLHSPAMWAIFQLQDILAIDDTIRLENPNDERINIPADPNHYWQYKMHLTLEELIKNSSFNTHFSELIEKSGR